MNEEEINEMIKFIKSCNVCVINAPITEGNGKVALENYEGAVNNLIILYEQEKEKNTELRIQISAEEQVCEDIEEKLDKEKYKAEALQKQHDYDMQMIDEVKGNAVKWANELEQEKEKNKSLKKQIKEMQEYYKNADFIFKDKIKAIQGQLIMQLGSYVQNEASPEQERIAGGINIINKILKGE